VKSSTLVFSLVIVIGCGVTDRGLVGPSDEIEGLLLSKTEEHARTLGVSVRGQITSSCPYTDGRLGWLDGKVAYYYRPLVETHVVVARGDVCRDYPRCEAATNIAAHEVCHTQSRAHDLLHWTCNEKLASATYPRPGSSGVWEGPAYTFAR